MHKSMLGLQHLKQIRDEERKSMQGTRHEQPLEHARHKTHEVQEHLRHVRHENM